ncbi:hypothetical protein [Virgibacillus kimchii]
MTFPSQLRKELKTSYFDLISECNLDHLDQLWTGMMKKLTKIVHASCAAIYLYDPCLQFINCNPRFRMKQQI